MGMFRHILIPSDGSPASEKAVAAALRFARDAGARVTAVHVVADDHALASHAGDNAAADADNAILAAVLKQATALHVSCSVVQVHSDRPHAAIIATALQRDCDLIAMASRGRGGLASLMLGSETQKVLTHSKIPVLVYRDS